MSAAGSNPAPSAVLVGARFASRVLGALDRTVSATAFSRRGFGVGPVAVGGKRTATESVRRAERDGWRSLRFARARRAGSNRLGHRLFTPWCWSRSGRGGREKDGDRVGSARRAGWLALASLRARR